MTEIENEARRRLTEVLEEQDGRLRCLPDHYLTRDRSAAIEALCRVLEEFDQYKQDVSDAAVEYNEHGSPMAWTGFDRFIITKPDPLAEALLEISGEGGYDNFDHYAYRLRSALEARGLELREIEAGNWKQK